MEPIFLIFAGVVVAWLAGLSFMLYKAMSHYRLLSQRTNAQSIDSVLESLIHESENHNKNIDVLRSAVGELDKDRHSYFQKFGFVKFNPFNDRVGDQSFIIALLDNRKNGFVKTFLYTRDGVRVYVKPIKDGKAVEFELSQEEVEAIKNAS